MVKQNTNKFQEFIMYQDLSIEEENCIRQIIEAFSEYMVAVNPAYAYNKTYLCSYVEEFIQCQKALRLKHQILLNNILCKISSEKLKNECIICVDDAWKFEQGKVTLGNTIDSFVVNRHKMQLQLEYVGENGFVIAEEISLDDNYNDIIDTCITTFIKLINEVQGDETERVKHT